MFQLAMIPTPYVPERSLVDKILLWFDHHGISQEILIFTLILMTVASLKTYLLRRVDWDSAESCFKWTALATGASMALGLHFFGLDGLDSDCAMLTFWAGAALLEGAIMFLRRPSKGLTAFTLSIGMNAAATFALMAIDVNAMFAKELFLPYYM